MLKFEQVGINLLNQQTTIEEIEKTFSYSCNCCCNRGIKLDCDRCAINVHKQLIVAILNNK